MQINVTISTEDALHHSIKVNGLHSKRNKIKCVNSSHEIELK